MALSQTPFVRIPTPQEVHLQACLGTQDPLLQLQTPQCAVGGPSTDEPCVCWGEPQSPGITSSCQRFWGALTLAKGLLLGVEEDKGKPGGLVGSCPPRKRPHFLQVGPGGICPLG